MLFIGWGGAPPNAARAQMKTKQPLTPLPYIGSYGPTKQPLTPPPLPLPWPCCLTQQPGLFLVAKRLAPGAHRLRAGPRGVWGMGAWTGRGWGLSSGEVLKAKEKKKDGFNTTLFPGGPPPQY